MSQRDGVSEDLLKKCAEAFDNNRGKVEREEEAVYQVLLQERNKNERS